MASFGENLRRERELRGVTLAALATTTKISVRYLNALESEQFDRLPGGVFNRGFVRSIARSLGLDEREWVAAFARAAEEEPEALARYAATPSRPRTTRESWIRFALLAMLFGAGLFAVHTVRARRAAEATPAPVSSLRTTAPAKTLPAATAPGPRLAAAHASAHEPGAQSLPEIPQAQTRKGGLQLQVFAIEDAWVSVVNDDRKLYQGLMRSGETRHFTAPDKLLLRTGNASALVLTLNGETLAPLGNPGEVKSITLSRKDFPRPRP